jgi:uncharacterized Zn finger protein
VPVAERRAKAAREIAKMTRKAGAAVAPVVLKTRTIASTFWGKAWCDNLEAYSDYANRLPRGRTYVRNGSVMDLQIAPGVVTALVSGSELYKIRIGIKPLPKALWQDIQRECGGQIDSLLELLQGRLSAAVMQIVTRPNRGLFPTPKEIDLDCSCPDWADLCKHVAAALYGVGARLDEKPELLFRLRGVDPAELIGKASAEQVVQPISPSASGAQLGDAELADVFGIELDTAAPKPAPAPVRAPTPAATGTRRRRERATPATPPKPGRAAAQKPGSKALKAPKALKVPKVPKAGPRRAKAGS